VEWETKNRIYKKKKKRDHGGGWVFSLDASSGRLATRWRLWRRCGSSALRSALLV